MTHARLTRGILALAAGALLTVTSASGQSKPDANGFLRISPDDLKWDNGPSMQSIVVAGDPTKPGIYVIRNRFPPGQMSRPHFHNQDRFVTVIKGTWWTASGPDADTFEYDGAKEEEVIVQIIGMGPVTTTNLPAR